MQKPSCDVVEAGRKQPLGFQMKRLNSSLQTHLVSLAFPHHVQSGTSHFLLLAEEVEEEQDGLVGSLAVTSAYCRTTTHTAPPLSASEEDWEVWERQDRADKVPGSC